MKIVKKVYNKPILKKYGNIKKLTKGAWTGGGDGIANKFESD